MAREIRHTIKGGKVTIETSGFGGESCKAATDAIEKKLGKTISDEYTDDYHATTEIVENKVQG